MAKVQMSGNDNSNRSCIREGIEEQFDVREYLPLFGPESFVFQFSVQKYKD
jgi:hypothetical protein